MMGLSKGIPQRPTVLRFLRLSLMNRVPVNKIFLEQNSIEPKVKVMIPMYKPLQVSKCEKCGKVIAESKELI